MVSFLILSLIHDRLFLFPTWRTVQANKQRYRQTIYLYNNYIGCMSLSISLFMLCTTVVTIHRCRLQIIMIDWFDSLHFTSEIISAVKKIKIYTPFWIIQMSFVVYILLMKPIWQIYSITSVVDGAIGDTTYRFFPKKEEVL
jgi:hypothetical protein